MKTSRTETKHDGNRGSWNLLAVITVTTILCSGCSVLDAIDQKLVAWGVVDGICAPGFDTLSVVEVDSGSAQGVGVILKGGLIFTANHVVRSGDHAIVRTFGYYRDGYYQTLEARVVYRNPNADQALLAILDAEDLDHTAELGKAKAGTASVLPLRAAGRSSFGYTLNKPVVRPLEITSALDRYAGNARLRKGDSGAPIVQDGRVVGLVMGASKMVAPDVMTHYRLLLKSRERRATGNKGAFEQGRNTGTTPECTNHAKSHRSF